VNRFLKSRIIGATVGTMAGASLVGCATKSYSPLAPPTAATHISPFSSTNSLPEVVVLAHEPAAVIGLDNVDGEVPPSTVPTRPAPNKSTLSFGRGWIPLRTWTDKCGFGAVERIITGRTTSFRVATKNGSCKLTVGTRLAQWSGITVWLGFAPQLIRGELFIHALDAEKILLPLAEGPAPLARRTIVLDPGHGGTDSGTRGAQHQLEKNYTLDWALRTERLLTNAGWNVFLTRRRDVDLSLTERIAIADRVQADLFISLHFNSTFPQTQPSGIETYCLTPSGMPSTLARGFADDERAIFPNNAFDSANLSWAFRLQRALIDHTREHDDGVKHARFMSVLRYQNRPAVLIEGGFLSNPQDAVNIQSSDYRETLARAIVDSIK